METSDRALLDQWMGQWSDIVDFDVIPIVPSAEAAATIASRLKSPRLLSSPMAAISSLPVCEEQR